MAKTQTKIDPILEGIQRKIAGIEAFLENYRKEGKKMFVTSSFQSHSLPMLHILSRIDKTIPVYFLNTGFHFAETLMFKDEVAKAFDLNLIELKSSCRAFPNAMEMGVSTTPVIQTTVAT